MRRIISYAAIPSILATSISHIIPQRKQKMVKFLADHAKSIFCILHAVANTNEMQKTIPQNEAL